jgi:hypothetical protein
MGYIGKCIDDAMMLPCGISEPPNTICSFVLWKNIPIAGG